MGRTIVIIPVFWGNVWQPGNGPISWTDVDADIRAVARSYYLAGLDYKALAPTASVAPAVVIDTPQDKIPQTFNEQDIWSFLDGLIDSGKLPQPSNWDLQQYRVYYGIAIAPGHSNADPNTFGQNNKTYRGTASAGYATANSDRAGVVTTYWHEVVEGAANDEIVDACRAQTFEVNGVRVSRYEVRHRCWPFIDLAISLDLDEPPRSEGPLSATVPVWDGLCGVQTLNYHVEYSTWRVTAQARAPQLDPSTFRWSIEGRPVPPGQSSTLGVPVDSSDPRPPTTSAHRITATVRIEQATDILRFTTDATDGNYAAEVKVETVSSASASDQVSVDGIRCPELDAADQACRDWYASNTKKLDRDWDHWVDPSDPLIAIIRRRTDVEQERLLTLVSAARQLKALGQPEAEEIAARIADPLGVEPREILPG